MASSNVIKVQLFCHMEGEGWSETYYFTGSDPLIWLYGVIEAVPPSLGGPNTRSMLGFRGGLMPPTAGINAIRASLDGSPHVAGGINFGFPGYVGTFSKTVGPNQLHNLPPYQRIMCKSFWQANALTYFANHYLGGCPGPISDLDNAFFPDGDWMKSFQNFVGFLTATGWVEKQRPAASTAVPIIAFTPSADGLTAQVSPVPAGIAAPGIYSVIIGGLKVPHGWNGQHRAVATAVGLAATPAYVTIGPLRKAGVTVPPWLPGQPGTIRAMVPTYPSPKVLQPVRLLKKDTGRPFGLPVGRRTRP